MDKEQTKDDPRVDQALTSDILNKVADLVGAINRAEDYGLNVSLKVDSSKVLETFNSTLNRRTKSMPQPPVRVWREVKYA